MSDFQMPYEEYIFISSDNVEIPVKSEYIKKYLESIYEIIKNSEDSGNNVLGGGVVDSKIMKRAFKHFELYESGLNRIFHEDYIPLRIGTIEEGIKNNVENIILYNYAGFLGFSRLIETIQHNYRNHIEYVNDIQRNILIFQPDLSNYCYDDWCEMVKSNPDHESVKLMSPEFKSGQFLLDFQKKKQEEQANKKD